MHKIHTMEQVRQIIDDPENALPVTLVLRKNPKSEGKTYVSHKIPFDE